MNAVRLFGPGVLRLADAPALSSNHQPRTALPVFQGFPRHIEAHLHRLNAGASAMDQPVDWLLDLQGPLETWLRASASEGDLALRLVLHPSEGLLSARLEPLPVAARPYRLVWRPHPLQACQGDPKTVHKGLSGSWGPGILQEARQSGGEDALLFWSDGSVAETALASVAVELEGVLWLPFTPGRVGSLAERLDLPAWATDRGLRIERRSLSKVQARAGRLWCMNALRGIWPATLL